ncbi:MAG: cytochrome b5 domain-containing protein [Bacillota bacterium]
MKRFITIFAALTLVITLTACGGEDSDNAEDLPEEELQEFTLSELSEFDGEDGADAYIAVDGDVYDVTDSSQWIEGMHQGQVEAGQDLTEALDNNTAHGREMLENVPKIGVLVEEEEETSSLDDFTLEELSQYDGKDGERAYIAVDGDVYDVTESVHWTEGLHQGRVEAGQDLTEALNANTAHGREMLDSTNVELVGTLIGEETTAN